MATAQRFGHFLSKGALNLRQWRQREGLSQFELSKLINYRQVTRLERGYGRPSLGLAIRVRRVTGIAVDAWHEPLTRREQAAMARMDGLDAGAAKARAPEEPTAKKKKQLAA